MNTINTIPESKLVKNQKQKHVFHDVGEYQTVIVYIRWDDHCGNGHNDFAITGEAWEKGSRRRDPDTCGCIHEICAQAMPRLVELDAFKHHLKSSKSPMYYIVNSMYHAKNGNLEWARASAAWPDAELEDFTEEKLQGRLPLVQRQLYELIINLGLEW